MKKALQLKSLQWRIIVEANEAVPQGTAEALGICKFLQSVAPQEEGSAQNSLASGPGRCLIRHRIHCTV